MAFVLFADRRPMRQDLLRTMEADAEVRWLDDLSPEESPAVLAETAVIISGRRPVNASMIAGAGRLRGIVSYGAAYEQVDVAAASQRGVMVTYTPGVNAASTSELALGLMICLARHVVACHRQVRSTGGSDGPDWLGPELYGKVLGLVGFGYVGQYLATVAKGFGMDVLVFTRRPSPQRAEQFGVAFAPLRDTLARADFIVVCCTLTEETTGLIGSAELACLKPTAYIVNMARGGIIDEPALGAALQAGTIAGAATDVLGSEPPGPTIPFQDLPDRFIVTPHIGGRTDEASDRLQEAVTREVCRLLRGEVPEHLVNPEVLSRRGRKEEPCR